MNKTKNINFTKLFLLTIDVFELALIKNKKNNKLKILIR